MMKSKELLFNIEKLKKTEKLNFKSTGLYSAPLIYLFVSNIPLERKFHPLFIPRV